MNKLYMARDRVLTNSRLEPNLSEFIACLSHVTQCTKAYTHILTSESQLCNLGWLETINKMCKLTAKPNKSHIMLPKVLTRKYVQILRKFGITFNKVDAAH